MPFGEQRFGVAVCAAACDAGAEQALGVVSTPGGDLCSRVGVESLDNQLFGIGILTLTEFEFRQRRQDVDGVGMIAPEVAPPDLQNLPVQRFGLEWPLLFPIELRQVVHRCERRRMLVAKHPTTSVERLLKQRLGLTEPSFRAVDESETIDGEQGF